MKFLKYIAAALLLVAGLTSCEMGKEEGTVGVTTVQFAQAVIEDGFAAGVVYVPLTITADTEEAMNTCNVTAKVKVVTTGETFEGTPDLDGLTGDYRVTSLDMNFPAYDNYYDEKEPKKYFNEETQKWTKEVRMEVFITNDEVDELRFTFEIESSNTTIGEQKQCQVIVRKTATDRMSGLFSVKYDSIYWIDDAANYFDGSEYASYFPSDLSKWPWTVAYITWYKDYECFIIEGHPISSTFNGGCFYAYFDDSLGEGKERMYVYAHDYFGQWADNAWMVPSVWDSEAQAWASEDKIYIDFDVTAGTLTFPSKYGLSISMFADQAGTTYISEIFPTYQGIVFTKQ